MDKTAEKQAPDAVAIVKAKRRDGRTISDPDVVGLLDEIQRLRASRTEKSCDRPALTIRLADLKGNPFR